MPLTAEHLGVPSQATRQEIDARWLMAFAAGIGDLQPCYMDTCRDGGIISHPVFAAAIEWEPILSQVHEPGFPGALSFEERARGVHSAQDLHIRRLVRPGDVLTTQMTKIGVFRARPGAFQVTKLTTWDEVGEEVFTTYMQNLFRGVDLQGDEIWVERPPNPPEFASLEEPHHSIPIDVKEEQAHVYAECARIWAPIHTDRTVALSAGLPELILHGTCTLALAVSEIINKILKDPTRVTRLGCQFSAMVLMPSRIHLNVRARTDSSLAFEVLTEEGKPALKGGFLCWKN